MSRVQTTCFDLAMRLIGVHEFRVSDHPLIQYGFLLCGYGPNTPDEVAWCSAFAQLPPHFLGLPRSKSAAARSWLTIGEGVDLDLAHPENDVVVLKRGGPGQPGPGVLDAPGHVGFFAGYDPRAGLVRVLGGNQGDTVSVASFNADHVLGVRRLA